MNSSVIRAGFASWLLFTCLALISMAGVPVANAGSDSSGGQAKVMETILADGLIDIDADGSVEQVAFTNSPFRHDIGQRLVAVLEQWRFQPIDVDGTRRNVRSSFQLKLELVGDDDKYWLRIAQSQFGTPMPLNPRAPSYPVAANRDGIEAEVLMLVGINADGSVAEVEPVRGQIFGKRIRSEESHKKFLGPFIRSATDAIQSWHFGYFLPRVDGEKTYVLLPVRYALNRRSSRVLPPATSAPQLFDAAARFGTRLADLLSAENRLGGDSDMPISLESESRIQPLEQNVKSTGAL